MGEIRPPPWDRPATAGRGPSVLVRDFPMLMKFLPVSKRG